MTQKKSRPGGYSETASNPMPRTGHNLTRRRAVSQRLPVLDCRRSDPWHYEPPTAGYEDAAAYLSERGLLPAPNCDGLRAMWRAGGSHRRNAARIAQAWELTA